jgi:hypothetical protein
MFVVVGERDSLKSQGSGVSLDQREQRPIGRGKREALEEQRPIGRGLDMIDLSKSDAPAPKDTYHVTQKKPCYFLIM